MEGALLFYRKPSSLLLRARGPSRDPATRSSGEPLQLVLPAGGSSQAAATHLALPLNCHGSSATLGSGRSSERGGRGAVERRWGSHHDSGGDGGEEQEGEQEGEEDQEAAFMDVSSVSFSHWEIRDVQEIRFLQKTFIATGIGNVLFVILLLTVNYTDPTSREPPDADGVVRTRCESATIWNSVVPLVCTTFGLISILSGPSWTPSAVLLTTYNLAVTVAFFLGVATVPDAAYACRYAVDAALLALARALRRRSEPLALCNFHLDRGSSGSDENSGDQTQG